jgi:hypothetical protein
MQYQVRKIQITPIVRFFLAVLFVLPLTIAAQKRCGTTAPSIPQYIDVTKTPSRGSDMLMINIFVHICADDNGLNRAIADSTMLRQLGNMKSFYAQQNICFNLVGMELLPNTDLNVQNPEEEEEELLPFLVPDMINIFVHSALTGDLAGTAYHIPNTYYSVDQSEVGSLTNLSLLAHEMGHCLGLLHTFETAYGHEEVPRSGPCKNCSTTGDLLCDTEADPHNDNYDTGLFIDSTCVYSGDTINSCGGTDYLYNMDPTNIMAYGMRSCRNHFTAEQGIRMVATIINNTSLLDCITPMTTLFDANLNITYSSGMPVFTAQTSMTVQGNAFTISGSAKAHFSATNVIIKPKVIFNPGTEGYISVKPSILCNN